MSLIKFLWSIHSFVMVICKNNKRMLQIDRMIVFIMEVDVSVCRPTVYDGVSAVNC